MNGPGNANAPVAFNVRGGNTPAQIHSLATRDAALRVVKTERVRDINGTQIFAVTQHAVNPGDSTAFPWEFKIASQYESYHFEKLAFTYKPQCSTALNGTLSMYFDYDVSDITPPTSMQKMSENWREISGNIWSPKSLECDEADLKKFGTQRFVRNLTPAPSQGIADDPKTYEIGRLWVATENVADTNNVPFTGMCGYVEVSYSLVLHTPTTGASVPCPPCPPCPPSACVPFVPFVGGGGTLECPAGDCLAEGGTDNCPCPPPPDLVFRAAYSTCEATSINTTATVTALVASTKTNLPGSSLSALAGTAGIAQIQLDRNLLPDSLTWVAGHHALVIIETLGTVLLQPVPSSTVNSTVTIKQSVTSTAQNVNLLLLDLVLTPTGAAAQSFAANVDWSAMANATTIKVDAAYAATTTPV